MTAFKKKNPNTNKTKQKNKNTADVICEDVESEGGGGDDEV